ncbi:MAG: hypothetical protein U1F10_08310 [Burkholderiales bacterium]
MAGLVITNGSLAVTRASQGNYHVVLDGFGSVVCPTPSVMVDGAAYAYIVSGFCATGAVDLTLTMSDGLDHQFLLSFVGLP